MKPTHPLPDNQDTRGLAQEHMRTIQQVMKPKIPSLADQQLVGGHAHMFPAGMVQHQKAGSRPQLFEPDIQRGRDCICGKDPHPDLQYYKCSTKDCQIIIHACCINARRLECGEIECSFCTIIHNDPLTDIRNNLVPASVLESNKLYKFYIDMKGYSELKSNKHEDYDVEVRCIKLDGEHFFEQTWPDKCEIKINDKVVRAIEPLQRISSLKKRKDEKLKDLLEVIILGTNTISIRYENVFDGKNSKIGSFPNYVFTVVVVKKLKPSQLLEKIKTNHIMDEKQCKKFICEKFFESKEIKISEVKVELKCKMTMTYLENPARGKYCSHLECFNLKSFLDSMSSKTPRNWVCPLCRKPCYKIIYDDLVQKILLDPKFRATKPSHVFFRKDGVHYFKEDPLLPMKKHNTSVGKVAQELINLEDDSQELVETESLGKRMAMLWNMPNIQIIQDQEFLMHLYTFARRKNYGVSLPEEVDSPGFSSFREKLQQRLETDLIANTCFQRLYEMIMAKRREREQVLPPKIYKKTPVVTEGYSRFNIRYVEAEATIEQPHTSTLQMNLLETILREYQIDPVGSSSPQQGLGLSPLASIPI